MKRRSFGRKVVREGSRVQVWERRGDGWELFVDVDRFKDEYGPYAR